MSEDRIKVKAKRKALTDKQRDTYSWQIQTTLLSFNLKGLVIGCYYATQDEVQLQSYCEQLMQDNKVAYPICKKDGLMDFYSVDATTSFKQNKYGIYEPNSSTIVAPNTLDIIIIPMVGFDSQLHRLGHGMGYYDRYLTKCHALKMGIAFEVQRIEEICTQPHDIDMDMIITEACIYKKSKGRKI